MRPNRALDFETGSDDRVTVVRPKILHGRWRWLLRLLGRPNYRVRLDARGSFVWSLCDGTRSVAEIAAAARAHFDDPAADAERRAAAFVLELARGGFIALQPPEDGAPITRSAIGRG